MTIGQSAKTNKLIDELMQEMTLWEKCSLLSGKDSWCTVSIPRLNIGFLVMTDGPHGVRPDSNSPVRKTGDATYFPTGVSMASTWNPDLIRELGVALAEETRAYGCDILLGPCVNIIRSPLAGRNFESMSEDPFLAGRIGAAWVDGIQSQGVGASLKHFACNNQETERTRGSSEVDERTLREIYLSQFEYIVKHSQPWTVMCSYNRINGTYASENEYLLTEILRKEWGFKGLVVSDWGAVHSIGESVSAGLDLEMPGPAKYRQNLSEAVANWQISTQAIDASARRVLELLAKTGHLGKDGHIIKGTVNTEKHQKLARKVASEAITLLKNDNKFLPLNLHKIKSLAVIGRNGSHIPQGGGSSNVPSPYRISALDAIKKLVGKKVKVEYHSGCSLFDAHPVDVRLLTTPDDHPGIKTEYYNNVALAGKPVGICTEYVSDRWWWGQPEMSPVKGLNYESFSGRWTTTMIPEADSIFEFCFDVQGSGQLFFNGQLLFKTHPFSPEADWGTGSAVIDLRKGEKYDFCFEFVKSPANAPMHVRFYTKDIGKQEDIQASAALAASCDAAIVFVGYGDCAETEGADHLDMNLPGQQDQLIEAVREANPNTVVILNTGVPVEMPWLDRIPALLQAYYPGQEGGNAIADILLGKVNPSGKLAASYPKCLKDTPAYMNFPGGREVFYGEGIFVGYRYYDTKDVAPLFPFGHGLSYTEFAYSQLQMPKKASAEESVTVKVKIQNVGTMAGQEIVQLYVADRESTASRPAKELKGFVKVDLKPGESRVVEFKLDKRSFAFYDVVEHDWKVESGKFDILIGSSSRNIRLKGTIVL